MLIERTICYVVILIPGRRVNFFIGGLVWGIRVVKIEIDSTLGFSIAWSIPFLFFTVIQTKLVLELVEGLLGKKRTLKYNNDWNEFEHTLWTPRTRSFSFKPNTVFTCPMTSPLSPSAIPLTSKTFTDCFAISTSPRAFTCPLTLRPSSWLGTCESLAAPLQSSPGGYPLWPWIPQWCMDSHVQVPHDYPHRRVPSSRYPQFPWW